MGATAHRVRKIAGTVELDASQAQQMFDATARFYLGIDGAEFLRKWDGGEYTGDACTSRVASVASLIPLIREERARTESYRRPRRIRRTNT
jgi:hypothetical protein